MSRILVIGGTLFIGRAIVRRLLERGDEVVILHRRKGTPFGDRVEEIQADRNDVSSLRKALQGESFQAVIDNVYDFERGTTAEQVIASALACAHGLQRYVFMSSVASYGGGLEHDEDDPLAPPDHPIAYSRNKAESERALFRQHATQKFPATTLRPPFIYGPENPYYREAFFWDRLLGDRPIIIPDDGARLMQFVHVADVAKAAILALDREVAAGHAYNVANYPAVTQIDFVRTLARVAGKEPTLVHVPRDSIRAAGGEIFHPPFYFGEYYDLPSITAKNTRVKRELDLELIPFEEGLRETFGWYQTQERQEPDFSWEDRLLASVYTVLPQSTSTKRQGNA